MAVCVCCNSKFQHTNCIFLHQQHEHRCYYCQVKCLDATTTVTHCILNHPTKYLTILRPFMDGARVIYRSLHFNVQCLTLVSDIGSLSVDENYALRSRDDANSPRGQLQKASAIHNIPATCTIATSPIHMVSSNATVATQCDTEHDEQIQPIISRMIELLKPITFTNNHTEQLQRWMHFSS